MKQLHAIVKGLVQGVFYRSSTKSEAMKLGLKGYVKNLPSGDVEVLAQGDEQKLKELLQWLYQGPSSAQVENVEYQIEDSQENWDTFSIRY